MPRTVEPGLSGASALTPSWPRAIRRWSVQQEWLSELGYAPLALVLCWSLFAIKGVPLTHDGMGLVVIEMYRRAYRAGDYFPIWTVFGENGHG